MVLKRVLIQDESHAVIFDMWGLVHIMEETNSTMGEIFAAIQSLSDFNNVDAKTLRLLYAIIYHGLAQGAAEERKEAPFTMKELPRIIRPASEVLVEIMQHFSDSAITVIGVDDQKKAKPEPKKATAKSRKLTG